MGLRRRALKKLKTGFKTMIEDLKINYQDFHPHEDKNNMVAV